MARLLLSASTLCLLAAAGCAGEDGVSYLTDLSQEPAGPDCPAGGVRIDTGADRNGDGTLGPSEVSSTEYVCAQVGPASMTAVVAEPAGENCAAGGAKIEAGIDTNTNGTLDAAEVTSTQYVCGSGTAQVVKAYSPGTYLVNTDVPVTVLSAEISTSGGGQLLMFSSADVYCSASECPASASGPAAVGYLWLSGDDTDTEPGNNAEYEYFYLSTGVTESMTRTTAFTVPAAGTYRYFLRAKDTVANFGVYRPAITLVFLPG